MVGDGGEVLPVRGHQTWALLARILLSDRPISRRQIASELFSETNDPLGSLRWCLASLRRAIGSGTLRGDPIELNLQIGTDVDIWNLVNGNYDVTGSGELLEGIEPKASAEFATWLLIERERTASLVDARIRQETMVAISGGDYDRAIRLSELAVRRRPLEESAHIFLTKSLALDGRSEAALEHVEATERSFLAELGEKPSLALRSAARRTIASPPSGVSPRAVVESLISSGVAALSAGAVEAGLDCLRRAAADAEAVNDGHLRAKSLMELGSALVHSVRGYDDEGAIYLRQATQLANECGAAHIASTGLCELGYVEALAGRRPAAADLLVSALESSGDDGEALAAIHGTMAFNLVDWGKVDEGLEHYERSLDHARTSGNRRREIWSLGLGGWGLLAADRLEEACAWLESCVAFCDDIRWLAFRPWPSTVLALARLRLQYDPVSVRTGLEGAFALSRQLGDPCWEAAAGRAIALTYAATDENETALQWLANARNTCVRVTDPYAALLVEILSDQIRVSHKSGQLEQATSIARELLSVAARTHADAHLRQAVAMIHGAGE